MVFTESEVTGAGALENRSGKIIRNEWGRWGFTDVELTSGSIVEIKIDDYWLRGVIEYWTDDYYWFSQRDGIPVILRSGIQARIPLKGGRGT